MGGITPAELVGVRQRLEAFAADVFESLARKDQRARGECYLRGLMLEGRRKSVEPMAQRLGEVHYQALHHFVAVSPWDWRPVRRRLAEVMTASLTSTGGTKPQAASSSSMSNASCHLGRWCTPSGSREAARGSAIAAESQDSGTNSRQSNGQLACSVTALTDTPSWQLAVLPSVPEYWRCTPTEHVPSLGKPVSSTTHAVG